MAIRRRRVHLARSAFGMTACRLIVSTLPAGDKWYASWRNTPPHWRCPRCHRAIMAWRATRPAPALEWTAGPAP